MKKHLLILIAFLMTTNIAFADFKEHYENAQKFYTNSQYSSAIDEFKKALRINYLDTSARIGLTNSYLSRATYFANNESNYEAAANDFRAALFYLKYYPDETEVINSYQAIETTTENLTQCMKSLNQDNTERSTLNRAKSLRSNGNFPAAAYEFMQVINSADANTRKVAFANIADIFAIISNDKKAVIYYKKAVALDQSNVALRLKYARILDKLGQDDLALPEYSYVLSKSDDNAEILMALEKIYTAKLEKTPNSAELNSNLGAILQKQKKYEAALKYYQKAEQLDPSNVTVRLNIGTLYQQMKDFPSALSSYNSVLAVYPNNIEANLYKAQALVDLGDNPAAIQAYKKVLDIEPTNVEAKKQIIEVLKTTMTPAQMLVYLSKDSVIDESSLMALYAYAKDLHKKNKNFEAISCYNEILKHKTDLPEVYVNLALAYSQKNDFESAKNVLSQAKVKFPSNSQIEKTFKEVNEDALAVKYDEAGKSFANGEFQKALNIYSTIQPPNADVLVGMAACYKGLNNNQKAIEYYKKAFTLDSKNSEIAYYIGVLYAEIENWTSAKIYLQKALALNPKNTHADDLLSSVVEQNNVLLINKVIDLYNNNKYDEALKIISQILTEDNKNSYAYYYRGLIYDAQEKPLPAIEEYKKAIANNSELKIVDYLIATAYDSVANYKEAHNYYKKFIASNPEEGEYKKYALSRLNDLKNYDQKK